ncbi:MAG: hypothetical protein K2Q26_02210 [Bdellovibrionales bacterium]|nr:hypothetical protein [Bdellovibrionales bacterium]
MMRAMGEFPGHILLKGIEAKKALMAEGKTEEEISTSIGETFKYADAKLKNFITAVGLAEPKTENLYRVRIFSFNEGEQVPENATKIEELHFITEYFGDKPAPKPVTEKVDPRNRGGGKKDRPKGPKSSPWGLSPEELNAKKEASARAAAAKTKAP